MRHDRILRVHVSGYIPGNDIGVRYLDVLISCYLGAIALSRLGTVPCYFSISARASPEEMLVSKGEWRGRTAIFPFHDASPCGEKERHVIR